MVELRDVGYRAGGACILDGVSVRFPSGQLSVVLGANGAGKSTLLRCASGLARPTQGEVRYDGRPIAAIDAGSLARTRAVLSQHVELAFPLPVSDVVMMGRYPHFGRVPSARDRAIVGHALDAVGLAAMRDRLYPTLSGGERQKVQLARVLAQIWIDDTAERDAGRVLFLDEPTNSLDVHHTLHLLEVARGLLARGCTVVAILHDLNLALEYGDHFVLLDGGRVAHEAERAEDIGEAELERVFRVRARRVNDGGRAFWRFGL